MVRALADQHQKLTAAVGAVGANAAAARPTAAATPAPTDRAANGAAGADAWSQSNPVLAHLLQVR